MELRAGQWDNLSRRHRFGDRLLSTPRDDLVEWLRTREGWKDLASLVQVRPKNDLFPIRARYPGGDTLNIGLNYLSADEPQWFTLADVLASKVLTGRTPEVIRALRFKPKGQQKGLKPIDIAGQTINPATDDFYQTTDHSSERDQSETGDCQRGR